MDGIENFEGRSRLSYPFPNAPDAGGFLEVAEGVFWLRMPLPFSLSWINVWALEDGDGWTLVDTGLGNPVTQELWQGHAKALLGGRPVRRLIVTHMHPDHVGLAGWMVLEFDCPLLMTRLEYVVCRMLASDTGREAPKAGLEFYRAAGWDDAALAEYVSRFGGFGRSITPLPDSFSRLSDTQELEIGGRNWRVVVGSGHSPEHACLHCPELDLLISGDQILPRISSNVSVFPTEPDADPLEDWLYSCRSLLSVVGENTLILPSHNEPFRGGPRRLNALINGHERSLGRLLKKLESPQRVVDTFTTLFARSIGSDARTMATGEALAHLNHLIRRGDVTRVRKDGVDVYTRMT